MDRLAGGTGRSFYPVVAVDHRLDDAVTELAGVRSTGQAGEALVS